VDATTEKYPGFATDLQAQYMALMTQAEGIALVVETIFENRFMHAQELARMGANIRLEGKQAIVAGPRLRENRGETGAPGRENPAGGVKPVPAAKGFAPRARGRSGRRFPDRRSVA
jgi:hypothetical protein